MVEPLTANDKAVRLGAALATAASALSRATRQPHTSSSFRPLSRPPSRLCCSSMLAPHSAACNLASVLLQYSLCRCAPPLMHFTASSSAQKKNHLMVADSEHARELQGCEAGRQVEDQVGVVGAVQDVQVCKPAQM